MQALVARQGLVPLYDPRVTPKIMENLLTEAVIDSNKPPAFPNVNHALEAWHDATIETITLHVPDSQSSDDDNENGIDNKGKGMAKQIYGEFDPSFYWPPADDSELVQTIANQNTDMSLARYEALNPPELNCMPLFLYGRLCNPHNVASVICDRSTIRAYEQAARMMPAWLLGHKITPFDPGSKGLGAEKHRSHCVAGMLLFSTTGRERQLLDKHKGMMFKQRLCKAEAIVEGKKIRLEVLTWVWSWDPEPDPLFEVQWDSMKSKGTCSVM